MKVRSIDRSTLDLAVLLADGWMVADAPEIGSFHVMSGANSILGKVGMSGYFFDFYASRIWGFGEKVFKAYGISISVLPGKSENRKVKVTWRAEVTKNGMTTVSFGDTGLIAAMRCFVTSKLGESFRIPDELRARLRQLVLLEGDYKDGLDGRGEYIMVEKLHCAKVPERRFKKFALTQADNGASIQSLKSQKRKPRRRSSSSRRYQSDIEWVVERKDGSKIRVLPITRRGFRVKRELEEVTNS